jgi:hypothetical protein
LCALPDNHKIASSETSELTNKNKTHESIIVSGLLFTVYLFNGGAPLHAAT